MRRLAIALCATAALAPAAPAHAATSKACAPVVNPYPGTRYEGTDIRKIRAVGISCSKARSVAKGAHRKAIGLPVPPDGVRRFSWNGWRVTGDVRGEVDRYVAARGSARVRWIF